MSEVEVLNVVGTGDPMDMIFMIPLVHEWGASRACGLEQDASLPIGCDAPIQRILTLAEPGLVDANGNGQQTLAMCETHYQSWLAVAASRPR